MAAPGIVLREIDLTGGSTEAQPSGRSAGVVGTATQGTAFVPLTFADNTQFAKEFGQPNSQYHAPFALHEWFNNASAGTYVRVLGAGDCKTRSLSSPNAGSVTNAGFVVGSQKVQTSTGQLANNPYATATGIEGRTYFLGCYMSESAGSWAFSGAGLQSSTAAQPIVRGVLFAASGVQITLSSSAPGATSDTYSSTAITKSPAKGWFTGSLDLQGGNQKFVLFLNGHNDSVSYPSILTSSFDPTSNDYFGTKLNRDPLLLEEHGYVLYNHYDIPTVLAVPTGSGVSAEANIRRVSVGTAIEEIVFCLSGSQSRNNGTTTSPNYEGFQDRYTHPMTPYFVSQNFGGTRYNLFKIHARSDGEYSNSLYKVSIKDIKYPTVAGAYAKFTVEIRSWDADDGDLAGVIESYANCNLDPDSESFIGKKIGDLNVYYDFDRSVDSQKVVEEGLYGKSSRIVRVEISDDVINKMIPTNTMPVGHRGYYHLVTSGNGLLATGSAGNSSHLNVPLTNAKELPVPYRRSINVGGTAGADGVYGESKLYWGTQFTIYNTLTQPNDGTQLLDANSLLAYTKYFPKFHTSYLNPWAGDNTGIADVSGSVLDADRFNNNLFTLENIQVMTSSDKIDTTRWDEAVYQRNGILNASLTGRFVDPNVDFKETATTSYLKFTTFMQGGFDGLNIFDADKFYMRDAAVRRELDNSNQGQLSGPTVAAYRKAVDIMSEKTYSDISLLVIPDMRHPAVTDYTLSSMQTRFDALYVMDIELKDDNNNYITSSISSDSYPNVNLNYTTSRFRNRGLNNSFGAAYFPNVNVSVDPGTGIAQTVRLPTSTMVLGAYSLNDTVGFAWTAPAGYNRATIPGETLDTLFINENVDTVYDAGINPLVSVPTGAAPSIVISGQRTLLHEGSSLDRVNVRRLLIEVRRRVKAVANTLLFEPNRESTIARFNSLVTPIMKQVQSQRGVERYRVQIDTTTTTQADIENNTIRGKIYLQPTKAAEFISIDFVAAGSLE